jgi:hypothetical protein
MTCADNGSGSALLQTVTDEGLISEGFGERWIEIASKNAMKINSDLSVGTDLDICKALKSNSDIAIQGVVPLGMGFRLTCADLPRLVVTGSSWPSALKPYVIGRDLVQRPESKWIIDFFGLSENEAKSQFPSLFNHLLVTVKPERDQNRRATRRANWWLFGENAPALRSASRDLDKVIATCRTAKHRIFTFVSAEEILDTKVIGVALADAYYLGLLSSKFHVYWSLRIGGWLGVGNDPTYNHSDCFGKFPFPADFPDPLKDKIRAEAEALDALRKRVLAEHEDLTLTKLYNVLEALKEGRALTEVERDIHDRGLVTLIRQHHDAIDVLVAEAYGWPADLSDEQILTRLVALNKERAAEEAKGLIRWLRPEFQAPNYAAPVTQTLDLGEAVPVLPDNVIPWPGSLPEQVSAVQAFVRTARIERTGDVRHCQGTALVDWVAQGPEGQELGRGTNVLELAPGNRIASITGFWASQG